MDQTAFYSWQSDRETSTNRNFIEDALKKAIAELHRNVEVYPALREAPLRLDKDTAGVPGTPPIVDVIFSKISAATVFVPDLTFVGQTEQGSKLLPNPNVLIEYGYALRALSHNRIVPVMNVCHGDPESENLPFNMRHLRRPITYDLPPGATTEERSVAKDGLVKDLVRALGAVLEVASAAPLETTKTFEEAQPSNDNPARFFAPVAELAKVDTGGFGAASPLQLSEKALAFLRLMPTVPVEAIRSSMVATGMLEKAQVRAMWDAGARYVRNRQGALAYVGTGTNVVALTQLFLSREIWGIDAHTLSKEHQKQWAGADKAGYFPCSALEQRLIAALESYLNFAKGLLTLPLPLKFIVGCSGIEGYRMTAPSGMSFGGIEFGGSAVNNDIVYEGQVTSYDIPAHQILRPFFEKVWEDCGVVRPDKDVL
jgi:hypothetical protein